MQDKHFDLYIAIANMVECMNNVQGALTAMITTIDLLSKRMDLLEGHPPKPFLTVIKGSKDEP